MNNIPPLYQWILSWLSPLSFLTGTLASFLSLAVIGKITSSQNIYDQNLLRFTLPLSAETLFYPTASQLISFAQRQLSDGQKTAVIIGGDSVFHGVGQLDPNLWSVKLQAKLGDDYKVINLAMRGSWPQEAGSVTAQGLLKLGYQRLIYVTDTSIGLPGKPDDGNFYKYLFWEAYYKGFLLDDPDRDKFLSTAQVSEADLEMRRLMWLNNRFHFNDLWTMIGYQSVFTVWNSIISGYDPHDPLHWLRPRRLFDDDMEELQTLSERYPPEYLMQQLEVSRGHCTYFKLDSKTAIPEPEHWQKGIQDAKILFPDELKKRTFVVVLYDSPYYRKRLSLPEQQCSHKGVEETHNLYQSTGYNVEIVSKDFNELDYRDRVHLSPSGGDKLATQIAPKIKQIAQRLGYLNDR
jgi:lysophospholipase L1-like esterase